MAKANELLRALRAVHGRDSTVQDYWKRHKDQWVEDLRTLRSSVRDWMKPIEQEGFALVADTDFAITEPDVGHYLAPGLAIQVLVQEPKQVMLRPRGVRVVGVVEAGGARVLGAMGRVDLESGVTREILLRFRTDEVTSWASFSQGSRRDLDEDLFVELLARTADLALP